MSEKPQPPARRRAAKEGELLPCQPENGHLINQNIVQILVEKDNPEEIEKLMQAELNFNRERLSIMREHAEKHPDAVEDRATKKFRRKQYAFLMALILLLLPLIFLLPTAIAIALCTIVMIIVVGIVLNGRERDNDAEVLVKVLDKLIRREQ